MDKEFERVRTEPVSATELEKLKTQVETSSSAATHAWRNRGEPGERAHLSSATPKQVNAELDHYLAVTPADMQRVAQQYFVPQNGWCSTTSLCPLNNDPPPISHENFHAHRFSVATMLMTPGLDERASRSQQSSAPSPAPLVKVGESKNFTLNNGLHVSWWRTTSCRW